MKTPGVWAGRWRFHHGAPTGYGHACDAHKRTHGPMVSDFQERLTGTAAVHRKDDGAL
jgi:hypothetical protein